MINAMSGGDGVGNAASLYFAQQLQTTNVSNAPSGLPGGASAPGSTSSSAIISGPGQLLSNLQELQTQDPTKFQQVTSQIAGQLQTAAQQTQGPQSTFLSNLATKFENVANGGSLSQLQSGHHHHHHHQTQQADSQGGPSQAQGIAALLQTGDNQSSSGATSSALQAYSQNSQSQTQGIAGLVQSSGSQSSSNSTLQQLFTNISTEVSQALAG
jgi:hypothetical protein